MSVKVGIFGTAALLLILATGAPAQERAAVTLARTPGARRTSAPRPCWRR